MVQYQKPPASQRYLNFLRGNSADTIAALGKNRQSYLEPPLELQKYSHTKTKLSAEQLVALQVQSVVLVGTGIE